MYKLREERWEVIFWLSEKKKNPVPLYNENKLF